MARPMQGDSAAQAIADEIMNDPDSDDADLFDSNDEEDYAENAFADLPDNMSAEDDQSQSSLEEELLDDDNLDLDYDPRRDRSRSRSRSSDSECNSDLDTGRGRARVRGARRGRSSARTRHGSGGRPGGRARGRGRGGSARGRGGRGRGRARPSLVQEWSTSSPDSPNDVPFTGQTGLHVNTDNFTCQNYFELFFSEDFLNHLVLQTNLYAQQYLEANPNLKKHSRVKSWIDTDIAEMKRFLALVFLMGIVKLPSVVHYWSTKVFYRHPIFGSIMTRNRFQLILRFLHFNDNSMMPRQGEPNYDRLFKVRPVVDHLHEKFQEVYTPRQNICVDESLLLWKGRLVFRQYLPLKRARYGIKLFLCCESDGVTKGSGGYCYRLRVYTGKDDPTTDIAAILPEDAKHLTTSEQIVVFLTLPLLDKGYTVYTDNWYSSLRLFLYLLSRKTLACGTVRVDRGIPDELRGATPPDGCCSIALCGDNKVNATKFVSTKDVHMLSTCHGHSETDVPNRTRTGTVKKPAVVVAYNHNMGGVDRQDQLIQPYIISKKTMKWSKKLFFHLMQTAACNAFLLAKHDQYSKTFLD